MAENSSIEWCDHTFNPWRGCTKISKGCELCYAAREAKRFPNIRGIWGDRGTRIVAVPSAWKAPVKWNRAAERRESAWHLHVELCRQSGMTEAEAAEDWVRRGEAPWHRPRVFCASLADVFEDWKGELRFPADIAPDGYVRARWDGQQIVREFEASADQQGLALATMDNAREELFRLIEATPYLDWLLLTKRPENVMLMVPEHWREAFPPNVWMGTTVETQDMANKRIPELLKIPAKVRFLSCEPLLGPVDFRIVPGFNKAGSSGRAILNHLWIIAGGESGPQARPMHPDWARSLRDQACNAGVPFLFKQWGEWAPSDFQGGPAIPGCKVRKILNLGRDGINNATRDMWPPGNGCMQLIGKKAAGRLLDGQEWNEFPKP